MRKIFKECTAHLSQTLQRHKVGIAACAWILCILFAVASSTSAIDTYRKFHGPSREMWCGNVVSDPILLFLNYGVPGLFVGSNALAWLAMKGLVRVGHAVAHGLVSTVMAGGYLGYAAWVWQTFWGSPLSAEVWWLPTLSR